MKDSLALFHHTLPCFDVPIRSSKCAGSTRHGWRRARNWKTSTASSRSWPASSSRCVGGIATRVMAVADGKCCPSCFHAPTPTCNSGYAQGLLSRDPDVLAAATERTAVNPDGAPSSAALFGVAPGAPSRYHRWSLGGIGAGAVGGAIVGGLIAGLSLPCCELRCSSSLSCLALPGLDRKVGGTDGFITAALRDALVDHWSGMMSGDFWALCDRIGAGGATTLP